MQSKILVGTGPSQDINLEVLIVLHGPLEVFVVLVVKPLHKSTAFKLKLPIKVTWEDLKTPSVQDALRTTK